MDQAEPSHSSLLWHVRECREDANLDRRLSDRRCHQKGTGARRFTPHIPTEFVHSRFRKKPAFPPLGPSTTNFISIPVRFSRAGMMSMIECVSARSAAGVDARPPIPISSPPLSFRSKRTGAAGSTCARSRNAHARGPARTLRQRDAGSNPEDSESGNGRPRSLLSRCLAEMPKFARPECQAWRCRHGLERSTRSRS